MQARVVVFPVKGRAWCFARPHASAAAVDGALPPPTLRDLWRGITSRGPTAPEKVESIVDFVADKMNRAWIGFGSAPEGSMKSRIHSFGLKLLSRVRPSEVLLKSVTKEGSERLQLLVSDCSDQWKVLEKKEISSGKDGNPSEDAQYTRWKLRPSKKLDGFLERRNLDEGLDCGTISSICKEYGLDKIDVLKYRDLP